MAEQNMNIVVAVNDKFIFPLKVMLYSLSENTDRFLDIWLTYCDLSDKNRKKLAAFVKEKCHGILHEIKIDEKAFREHDASKSMFSTETFYRLYIPYVLPGNVERALWLDADMVVNGNIDEFYDSDFGERGDLMLVAAWNDKDRQKFTQYKERLGDELKTNSYFNAGVILFHLPAIRKEMEFRQIMEFWLKNQPKLTFLDQDVVNCLMGEKTVLKDSTLFNNQAHADPDAKEQLGKARIIHYVSYRKPWKLYYEGEGDGIFWRYAKRCGFGGKSLIYHAFHGPTMVVYGIYKIVRYGK